MQDRLKSIFLPVIAIFLFLCAWHAYAKSVKTSLGDFPTPGATLGAMQSLIQEYKDEKARYAEYLGSQAEKERVHTERQERRRAVYAERGKEYEPKPFKAVPYAPKPTYLDQMITSLKTVFAGFLIATVIAIPIGIICGVSKGFYAAINPLIQLLKPVSPLAWLPLVTLGVSASLQTATGEGAPDKAFIISAFTVALCSLWPTLINTALGVASVSKDHVNVARVLQLPWHVRVTKIILPTALPYMFTGLRISLGIGWMVLIAAEMLAQNPGLGKYIWDMFQNGSSQTLAMIMFAVLTIGIIGFLLDRMMLMIQNLVSYDKAAA